MTSHTVCPVDPGTRLVDVGDPRRLPDADVPASGCSSPRIIVSKVVLPTPFGPMTPTMPFGGRLKLSPSISIRSPNPLAR